MVAADNLHGGVLGGAALVSVTWLRRRWLPDSAEGVRYDRRRSIELPDESAGEHHRVVYIPGNESLALDIAERAVEIPRLPASLDGLTIVHLSDLHFTGRVGKSFFRHVVRLCNELAADLAIITGDLVDKDRCLDWIPEILGPP